MPIVDFPDTTIELGQKQVELLVKEGYVKPKKGKKGGFEGFDSNLALGFLIERPETMVCDFCGGEPVKMEYPCRAFWMIDTPAETQQSIGAWMACDVCTTMIEDDNFSGLTDRAIIEHTRNDATLTSSIEAQVLLDLSLRPLHLTFREQRVGPGRRI